jgi:hypothetical protein
MRQLAVPLEHMANFDKNSSWDGLNIQKGGLVCQEINLTGGVPCHCPLTPFIYLKIMGALRVIRTPDLWIHSPALYPSEQMYWSLPSYPEGPRNKYPRSRERRD